MSNKRRIFWVTDIDSETAEQYTSLSYKGTIFVSYNDTGTDRHGDIYKDGILYTYVCGVDEAMSSITTQNTSYITLTNDEDTHLLKMASYSMFPKDIVISYSLQNPNYNFAYVCCIDNSEKVATSYNFALRPNNSNIKLSKTNNVCKITVSNQQDTDINTILRCQIKYSDNSSKYVYSNIHVKYNTPTNIVLYPDELYIKKNSQAKILADILPVDTNDTELSWYVADTTIVQKDNDSGFFTGKNEGHTTTYAYIGNVKSNTVLLHVIPEVAIENLTLTTNRNSISSNDTSSNTAIITAHFIPTNPTNKTLTWHVTNPVCEIVKAGSENVSPCDTYTTTNANKIQIRAIGGKIGTTFITAEHIDETGNELSACVAIEVGQTGVEAMLDNVKNLQLTDINNNPIQPKPNEINSEQIIRISVEYLNPNNTPTYVDSDKMKLYIYNITSNKQLFETTNNLNYTHTSTTGNTISPYHKECVRDGELKLDTRNNLIYAQLRANEFIKNQDFVAIMIYDNDIQCKMHLWDYNNDTDTFIKNEGAIPPWRILANQYYPAVITGIQTSNNIYTGNTFNVDVKSESLEENHYVNEFGDAKFTFDNREYTNYDVVEYTNNGNLTNYCRFKNLEAVHETNGLLYNTYMVSLQSSSEETFITYPDTTQTILVKQSEINLNSNNYNWTSPITITSKQPSTMTITSCDTATADSSIILNYSDNNINFNFSKNIQNAKTVNVKFIVNLNNNDTYITSGNYKITKSIIVSPIMLSIDITESQYDISNENPRAKLAPRLTSNGNDVSSIFDTSDIKWYVNNQHITVTSGDIYVDNNQLVIKSTSETTYNVELRYKNETAQTTVTFYASYQPVTVFDITEPPQPIKFFNNITGENTKPVHYYYEPSNAVISSISLSNGEGLTLSNYDTTNETITLIGSKNSTYNGQCKLNINRVEQIYNLKYKIIYVYLDDISVVVNGTTTANSLLYNTSAITQKLATSVKCQNYNGEIPFTQTIRWTSSNTNIAEINNSTGVITTKGTGSVTFTATLNESINNNTITVSKTLNIVAPSLSLNVDKTNVYMKCDDAGNVQSNNTVNATVNCTNCSIPNISTLKIICVNNANSNVVYTNDFTVSSTVSAQIPFTANGVYKIKAQYLKGSSLIAESSKTVNVYTQLNDVNFDITFDSTTLHLAQSATQFVSSTNEYCVDFVTSTQFNVKRILLPSTASIVTEEQQSVVQFKSNSGNVTSGSGLTCTTKDAASDAGKIIYRVKQQGSSSYKTYTISVGSCTAQLDEESQQQVYSSSNTQDTINAITTGNTSDSITYQWRVNNVNKGTNSSEFIYVYSTASDNIQCILTLNSGQTLLTNEITYSIVITNINLDVNFVILYYGYDLMGETHGNGFKLPIFDLDSGGGSYGDTAAGFIYTKDGGGGNESHTRFTFEAYNTDVKLYCTHNNDGVFYRTPNGTALYTKKDNQTVHTIYHLLGNKQYDNVSGLVPYNVSTGKIVDNVIEKYGDLTSISYKYTQNIKDINGSTNGFVEAAVSANNSMSDEPIFLLNVNNALVNNTLTLNFIFSMNGNEPQFDTITLSETQYNDGSGNSGTGGGGTGGGGTGGGGGGSTQTEWASNYVNINNAYCNYEFHEAGASNGDDLYDITVHFEMEPNYPNSTSSNEEQTIQVSISGISTNIGDFDTSGSVEFTPDNTEYKHFNFRFSKTTPASPGEIKNVAVTYQVFVDNFTGADAQHNGSSSTGSFEISNIS